MIRKISLTVLTVLAIATSSQAAIMLQATQSAVQPTIESATGPLVAWDLRAVSDSGQTINTVENPNITANVGSGLHQVWTPIVNGPTPTRAEQAPPLWSDTWQAYDSYWLFDAANSLSVGGAFTETNTPGGGAALPTAGFGAPSTGFGTLGSVPPASKLFTVGSGLPDSDVTFAQLVLKQGESVNVNLTVYDNTGESALFTDFCVGECGPPPPVFEVGDLFLQGYLPGQLVSGGPLPTNDDDDPDSGIAWSLVSLIGPGGVDLTGEASVDPVTGVFTWDSDPTDAFGAYAATIQGINDNTPAGTASGVMSFNLVPEPGTLAMLAFGMIALGLGRRRD